MVVFRPSIPPVRNKPLPTIDVADVAARHLLYKLFEATEGQPGAWHGLSGIGERPETVDRAVERGWMVVQAENGKKKLKSASLTNEGRLVARRGLRS